MMHSTHEEDYIFGGIGAFCDGLLIANYDYANRDDSSISGVRRVNAIANYYYREELRKEVVNTEYEAAAA